MQNQNRQQWSVSGMDCAACTLKVTKAVERLPGVSAVKVALMAERLSLSLEPGTTTTAEIEQTVRKLGYQIDARPSGGPAQPPSAADADLAPRRPEACADHDHSHPHRDHSAHDPHITAGPAGADLPLQNGKAAHAAQVAGPGNGSAGHESSGLQSSGHGAPGHVHDDPKDRGKSWHQTGKGRLVILTGVMLGLAWGFGRATSTDYGYWAFVLACLIGLAPVARRAWAALRMGQPFTIESLMTIAAAGALVIGAAEEAALVVFLFAVGELLEGVAAGKAREGIRALADLVPKTAQREDGAQLREVPASSLGIGQIIRVRPGERLPADGLILEGRSGVDDSPVTGESMPRSKGPGDAVYAGSINTEAVLRITVTKAAADNTIARIIRLVEEAEEARAPTERFIDRFSRWYMPAIVLLSALVVLVPPLVAGGDWGTWVYRGLALLLIGCPCALVISVPASIASALSCGARRGLLMKGGAVIEAAANVRQIAFDKTGTLTHGKPVITDILPAAGKSASDLLAVAAAVESGSNHPLAQAVLARAAAEGAARLAASEARALVGKGVEALVDGTRSWVASPRHAAQLGGLSPDGAARIEPLEREGKTVVVVFQQDMPLGLIALRDEPRADAAQAMQALHQMGIKTIMLTGDNPRTAAAIATGLGLDFRAEMMPEDKLDTIRSLSRDASGGTVMMIGDGINDAPALKQADVGVAMGSGTDVALETADAAILRDQVSDVPRLIRLARATMGNIRQNIGLALGLKAVFLVTSVLGMTGLWIAILADTGATVLVTLNAMRLLRFEPDRRV